MLDIFCLWNYMKLYVPKMYVAVFFINFFLKTEVERDKRRCYLCFSFLHYNIVVWGLAAQNHGDLLLSCQFRPKVINQHPERSRAGCLVIRFNHCSNLGTLSGPFVLDTSITFVRPSVSISLQFFICIVDGGTFDILGRKNLRGLQRRMNNLYRWISINNQQSYLCHLSIKSGPLSYTPLLAQRSPLHWKTPAARCYSPLSSLAHLAPETLLFVCLFLFQNTSTVRAETSSILSDVASFVSKRGSGWVWPIDAF